jgi:hypothetical protein
MAEALRVPGLAQVEHDALLVPAQHLPQQGDAVLRVTETAQRITGGLFDLDDLGAEVAEEPRGERPREQRGDVDHGEAGQGERAVWHALMVPGLDRPGYHQRWWLYDRKAYFESPDYQA